MIDCSKTRSTASKLTAVTCEWQVSINLLTDRSAFVANCYYCDLLGVSVFDFSPCSADTRAESWTVWNGMQLPYRNFFIPLETIIPPLLVWFYTIPVCRMANAGRDACKCRARRSLVTRDEIFSWKCTKILLVDGLRADPRAVWELSALSQTI